MSVERRYSKRYPMQGDVYIRYRKQRAFPARAVNCSLYGISLQTENLSLLSGSLVELEFFYQGRQWLIMGIVTHSNAEGLGVMFWQTQPEFYEAVVSRATGLPQKTLDQTGRVWSEAHHCDSIQESSGS